MPDHASRSAPLILVADPDTATRLFVEHTLAAEGLAVVHASDGARAVDVFEHEKPDLILIDMHLPGMDGPALCTEIRGRPHGRAVPVLVLTGHDDPEALDRASNAGATDFAAKPLAPGMLRHRVRHMLRVSRTLDELRKSEERLAAAQKIASMGHWEWDPASDAFTLSEEAARLLRLEGVETPALRDLLDRVHPADAGRLEDALSAAAAGRSMGLDHRIQLEDGSIRSLHTEASVAPGFGNRPGRILGVVQDMTERAAAEARIRALAHYDSLTGLPNRIMFGDLLRAAIARAIRHKHHVAAMFLDLDNFKRINDTMGHAAGDELLAHVAKRLRCVVREHDPLGREVEAASPLRVARLGGDEFLMALTDLARPDDAGRIATRIVEAMSVPFVVNGNEMYVSGSIGISIFPNDGTDVDELLKNADAALYHAKDLGRNTFAFYDESMNQAALERLLLEGQIRRALERDEFVLYYQPQIDAASNRVIGAEALLRWDHPDMGLISPSHFINILEHTGLIHSVGEWVLVEACRQLRAWHDAGHSDISVCINLSAVQFRYPRFIDSIRNVVRDAGLDPRSVELEVTESAVVENGQEAIRMLGSLGDSGFRISMDDFGTGYSWLGYLRRFAIDRIKIDRSFVRDAVVNPRDAAIVSAIIQLARTLEIEPFGEGIELAEQRELLLEAGCTLMQGNFFGRPMPPADIQRLFSSPLDERTAVPV